MHNNDAPLRITYLTAGAAGMYCGSCMHDNTLARALLKLGVDVQLVPMYTPIQTDEDDVSIDQVFFGGINVYLQQCLGLFRFLPKAIDRLLDRPSLLRWIGSRGVETNAAKLGDLTLSMLRGSAGFQRKEVQRLSQWLERGPRPDLLVLSNVLVSGCVPDLKRALQVPVAVTLQGDDLFLDELPGPDRTRALDQIRCLAKDVDAFLVHSRYYAGYMSEYLGIDPAKFRVVPLGIDTTGYFEPAAESDPLTHSFSTLRVGYLARLAPEKGLHILVDAFIRLKELPGMAGTQLLVAGWLGKRHEAYAAAQLAKLQAAGLGDACRFLGPVDRAQKVHMLRQLHLFSVPTVYRESKGLYVLESLAAGVPVVQPSHGVFPELLAATGGGRLVPPHSPAALADTLHELLLDHATRQQLAVTGRTAVQQRYNARAMAEQTLIVLRHLIAQ
ncbi:MAG: glycosyltransferase family 4 protein [Pirellulaceae bacterium]